MCMMSVMMAGKMLRKSCPGYLAYVVEVREDDVRLEDIPVVREFLDELSNIIVERKWKKLKK